jgi:hypothetical protein
MVHDEPLAGPKTAKRKIQIREYVTNQRFAKQSQSNAFLPDCEEETEQCNSPERVKYTFRLNYQPDLDSDDSDEILSSKVDLDEADRFIAALRIPGKRTSTPTNVEKKSKHVVLSTVDLSAFRKESERLEELRLAQSEDPPEEDDRLI